MTDLADYTPGPALLAARQKLLEGIAATWKRPITRSSPKAAPPSRHERVIDLDEAAAAVDRYTAEWAKARQTKVEIVEYSARTKTSPPNNYWVPEHQARGRLIAAMAVLEALLA